MTKQTHYKVRLSHHARQRLRERTNFPVRAFASAARRAWREGINSNADDCPQEISDYVASRTSLSIAVAEQGFTLKIFQDRMYLFAHEIDDAREEIRVLVTVMPLHSGRREAIRAPEDRRGRKKLDPFYLRGKLQK